MNEGCSRCQDKVIEKEVKYCSICGSKLKTAPETLVQEQFIKDRDSEILVLIITANSLISKAISMIKNDVND